MVGLRQLAKKDSDVTSEEDIEAPKGKESSTKFTASANNPSAPSGAAYNPVFLAKVIIRKVVSILMTSDEGDITRPGGIITLLRDIILGLVLGVAFISSFIIMDHVGVVRSQSARNFRHAAFQLLNDPETIAYIEESSDLTFLTSIQYEGFRKELDHLPQKKTDLEKIVNDRLAEAEANRQAIEAIRGEHETLSSNPLLELNKFCGECSWAGKTTCAMRVKFMEDTYNSRPIGAKMSAMEVPTCKKQ